MSRLLVEGNDHPLILVVFVDAVSNAISSALSTARFRRTVPVSASSMSTTLRSLVVASSLPVSAAS